METSYVGINLPETTCKHEHSDLNSILGSVNTGFDKENSLTINSNCGTTNPTVLRLSKENYLSEFETEEDKNRVRLNLNVPSISDMQQLIKLSLLNYATKADVGSIIAGTLNLSNYYTKSEVELLIKKSAIKLDLTPTQYSKNSITSGGVWDFVDDIVGGIYRFTLTI